MMDNLIKWCKCHEIKMNESDSDNFPSPIQVYMYGHTACDTGPLLPQFQPIPPP